VAILGYSEPLSAVLFSVLLLGEKMLPLQIVGAVLIIGGALLGESAVFKGRKNRQAHTDAQT
ncbi:MAG: EamA family transporter, partial [Eubacteriales bacterium]